MGEPIITIDLHGCTQDEAARIIDRALARAGQGTYRIRLVHGYNRGTALKTMIQDYYRYDAKVKRIVPGENMGITELVLREW